MVWAYPLAPLPFICNENLFVPGAEGKVRGLNTKGHEAGFKDNENSIYLILVAVTGLYWFV